MIDFMAEKPMWVVLTELVELVVVEPDQQFTSGQVCEVFMSEALAHERMLELDPNWVDNQFILTVKDE